LTSEFNDQLITLTVRTLKSGTLYMIDPEHLKIFKQGVRALNKWRKEHPKKRFNLFDADLSGAYLSGADLYGANLSRANLSGANLREVNLHNADLSEANLSEANLHNADLSDANLRGANLSSANLSSAEISDTDFVGATLKETILRNAIGKANFKEANLSQADLRQALLVEANFKGANLYRVDLVGARLEGAKFENANLREADLQEADLQNAHLQKANLMRAKLRGARVEEADIECANLTSVDFNNADVTGVHFKNLGKCKGIRLEGCYGSPKFVREAKDNEFIEEFKNNHPIYHWFWWISSYCGRSLRLWILWSTLFASLFALIISILGKEDHFDCDLPFNGITEIYYSIVTFTTFGFGDITPISIPAMIFVTIEVIIGYLMLGGLISILATKLARRAF